MVGVTRLFFVFLTACSGAIATGDDAGATQDAALDGVVVTGGDAAGDVALLDGDASEIALCPVACNPETWVARCCVDSTDDSGATVHVCSDAGIPTATTTCAP